jgi:hypothetical protein
VGWLLLLLLSELLKHLFCLFETHFYVVVSALHSFDLLDQVDYVRVKMRVLVIEAFDFANAGLTAGAS